MKTKIKELISYLDEMDEALVIVQQELSTLIPRVKNESNCDPLLWKLEGAQKDYNSVKPLVKDALAIFNYALGLSSKQDIRSYCFGAQDLISELSHDVLDNGNKLMDRYNKTDPCSY